MEIYERKSISMFVMILEKSSKDWSISGGFWSMFGKLQLQLYTGKYYNSIEELTEEEWKILDSIGYGNLFPLELPSTLKKKIYVMGIQV